MPVCLHPLRHTHAPVDCHKRVVNVQPGDVILWVISDLLEHLVNGYSLVQS